jgi:hypothetical protein
MRLSMDCKATVKIGDYSRGGKTRGDHRAADHDMGCEEKHTPFGVVNEDSGSLHLSFGSSAKTSDFIIDSLYAWWERQAPEERARVTHLQIKADNGPESNGRRTQFLKRMVQFADHIGKSIRLLYYPPYHSKYNPVERKRSAPPPLEAQDHAGLLSGLRGNNSSMRLFGQEGSFSRVLVSQAMGSMSFMRAVSSRD